MNGSPRLVIRTDANADMGTGHVMRMIALAQAWREDGGNAVFLCAEITPPLEQRIRNEEFQLEKFAVAPGARDDLRETLAAVSRHAADSRFLVVAVDGYQFDGDFQLGLRQSGCRLLAVDDYGHCDHYHADFVLNQNVSAREELYPDRDSSTRLLLGPKYALLRREFTDNGGWVRTTQEKASKLLVTLGGADAGNVTEKVIHAVASSGLEVKVVVGGSNPHLASLRRAAAAASVGSTSVDLVVNTSEMPGLMKWADLAVAAGGCTSWELAYLGVPTLFIILATNQEQNAHELERQGFGISLGEHSQFDVFMLCDALNRLASNQDLRTAFAARGREIVDGLGAKRVVSVLSDNKEIDFRPVMEEDLRLIWEWANDPATRANSFESAAIPWEQHRKWCESKMNNAQCNFWVASNRDREQVGVVRFDRHDGEAMVSISVAPHARRRGYGRKIIESACRRLFQSSEINIVRALIKPTNRGSIKVFQQAGFRRDVSTTVKGQAAEQYLLHRSS